MAAELARKRALMSRADTARSIAVKVDALANSTSPGGQRTSKTMKPALGSIVDESPISVDEKTQTAHCCACFAELETLEPQSAERFNRRLLGFAYEHRDCAERE